MHLRFKEKIKYKKEGKSYFYMLDTKTIKQSK
jgi:hypothetical protein